jgi:hypothetical protein
MPKKQWKYQKQNILLSGEHKHGQSKRTLWECECDCENSQVWYDDVMVLVSQMAAE